MRKLYWTSSAFKNSTNFDHIKTHYYWSHPMVDFLLSYPINICSFFLSHCRSIRNESFLLDQNLIFCHCSVSEFCNPRDETSYQKIFYSVVADIFMRFSGRYPMTWQGQNIWRELAEYSLMGHSIAHQALLIRDHWPHALVLSVLIMLSISSVVITLIRVAFLTSGHQSSRGLLW